MNEYQGQANYLLKFIELIGIRKASNSQASSWVDVYRYVIWTTLTLMFITSTVLHNLFVRIVLPHGNQERDAMTTNTFQCSSTLSLGAKYLPCIYVYSLKCKLK